MNIRETTLDCFGSELGQYLLDNKAVVPVREKRAFIKGWQHGVDPDGRYGAFDGLAVINGARSGILTVDIDSLDISPPAPFNVRTTHGGHIYLPWEGEKRQIDFVASIDLLGTGGYAVFAGQGKTFLHHNLADRAKVTDWLSSFKPPPLKGMKTVGYASGFLQLVKPVSVDSECRYKEKLEELGYFLELETISKQYASQMRNTPEGVRNKTCHRLALEVIRCEADLDMFAAAAVESGLTPKEVQDTIDQAQADIDYDYRPEVEIYERVQLWLDAYSGIFSGVMLDIALCLAHRAIVTNNSGPSISQVRVAKDIGAGGGGRYIGRVLKIMQDKYGAVLIRQQAGTWGAGLTHCNNYDLTIHGEHI